MSAKAKVQRARASITMARRMTPRSAKKDKKPIHRGWLEKRGPTHDFGWEKRWCVVTEEEIDFYEDESEEPEKRTGEILLSEYTATCEFKKKEAPGEAAKYIKTHPFGFVVDTEPYNGPKRLGMFYLAADKAEDMNQWIIQIHKAAKHLKNMAPANRTSLAEFVALWDAPVVLCSAPDLGMDKLGKPMLSVPAICHAVVSESSARARCSVVDGGGLDGLASAAAGWFSSNTQDSGEEKKHAFPLHKYFSTPGLDFSCGHFCETRVRTVNPAANGQEPEIVTGRNDLDVDLEPAFKGPGQYNEEARMELAVENSFSFTYWRGMVIGALTNVLVAMGNKPLPQVNAEKDTRIGKMSQASAQGLRIGDAQMPNEEFCKYKVRVVIGVSIDGGPVEGVQKKHLPRMCKEVIGKLKKAQYPWADDAWTVWCHFPTAIDFVKSLAGHRNLVPDNGSGRQIGEDDDDKPITYMTHRFKRQPAAPSLLGNTDVEEIIKDGFEAVNVMIETLLTACDDGNLKQVKSILDKKCHVGAKDDAGMSGISVAAGQGHAEIVKELLMRRADIDTTDAEGDTVLTVAVGEGKHDVVELLLANGADREVQVAGAWVDKPDTVVTLLDVAQAKGFTEIAEALKPKAAPAAPKPKLAGLPPRPNTLADELSELGGLDPGM